MRQLSYVTMFLDNEYCGNLAFSVPICFSSVGFRFFCNAFYGRLLWILCEFVFWANSNDTGLTHRRQAAKTTVRLVALCVILLLGASFVFGSTRRENKSLRSKTQVYRQSHNALMWLSFSAFKFAPMLLPKRNNSQVNVLFSDVKQPYLAEVYCSVKSRRRQFDVAAQMRGVCNDDGSYLRRPIAWGRSFQTILEMSCSKKQ